MIFIDHSNSFYLPDFLLLEKYGVIRKGSLVIADNVIFPGSPKYIAHLQNHKDYESVLIKSFVEYTDITDGVMFSTKLI